MNTYEVTFTIQSHYETSGWKNSQTDPSTTLVEAWTKDEAIAQFYWSKHLYGQDGWQFPQRYVVTDIRKIAGLD
jgi:hypothetical protein